MMSKAPRTGSPRPPALPPHAAAKALEAAAEAVLLVEDRERIIYVNPAACRASGYPEEELLQVPLSRLGLELPPEHLAPYRPREGTRRPWPASRTWESGLLTRDGQRLPLELSLAPFREKERDLVWIFARDITARKRAEEVLLESETRFKSAFDDPALGMIIFSPEGRFLAANPYVCRMLGYSEAELKTKRFVDVTHPEDRELSLRTDREILSGKMPFAWLEKRYLHRDGSLVWVILSSSLIRDKEGRPDYFISHVQDVTEKKRAEEEVKAQGEKLQLQAQHLQEVNTALKVLLDHREQERIQQERDILAGLNKLALPYLEKLSRTRLEPDQRTYLQIALANLSEIASPLAARLSSLAGRLTPAELEVADLLRHGKTTLEMAELLRVSPATVAFHRRNIRAKLGLVNQKINLKAYLRSLD